MEEKPRLKEDKKIVAVRGREDFIPQTKGNAVETICNELAKKTPEQFQQALEKW